MHLAVTMATYGHVLGLHQEALNALNVYPVPDGDTGTNMALTLESVVAELAGLEGLEFLEASARPGPPTGKGLPFGPVEMAAVCKAIAHGSLMGARGNSGVILSQILRGIAEALRSHPVVDGPVVADGLRRASETQTGPGWPRACRPPATRHARRCCDRSRAPS